MSSRLVLSVLLFSLVVSGFVLLSFQADPNPYRYVAYDASGTVVVRGTLFVDIAAPDEGGRRTIAGTWATNQVVDAAEVGPQVGEGHLEGAIDSEGKLSIDMNPNPEGHIWTTILLESEQTDTLSHFRGQWILMQRKGMGPTIRKVMGTFDATRE